MTNAFSFELNFDKSYKDKTDIDEWGSAILSFGDYGAEYNFCIDGGQNSCAIYYFCLKDEDYPEIDYDVYEHYEIDWRDKWEVRLFIKMFDFVMKETANPRDEITVSINGKPVIIKNIRRNDVPGFCNACYEKLQKLY